MAEKINIVQDGNVISVDKGVWETIKDFAGDGFASAPQSIKNLARSEGLQTGKIITIETAPRDAPMTKPKEITKPKEEPFILTGPKGLIEKAKELAPTKPQPKPKEEPFVLKGPPGLIEKAKALAPTPAQQILTQDLPSVRIPSPQETVTGKGGPFLKEKASALPPSEIRRPIPQEEIERARSEAERDRLSNILLEGRFEELTAPAEIPGSEIKIRSRVGELVERDIGKEAGEVIFGIGGEVGKFIPLTEEERKKGKVIVESGVGAFGGFADVGELFFRAGEDVTKIVSTGTAPNIEFFGTGVRKQLATEEGAMRLAVSFGVTAPLFFIRGPALPKIKKPPIAKGVTVGIIEKPPSRIVGAAAKVRAVGGAVIREKPVLIESESIISKTIKDVGEPIFALTKTRITQPRGRISRALRIPPKTREFVSATRAEDLLKTPEASLKRIVGVSAEAKIPVKPITTRGISLVRRGGRLVTKKLLKEGEIIKQEEFDVSALTETRTGKSRAQIAGFFRKALEPTPGPERLGPRTLTSRQLGDIAKAVVETQRKALEEVSKTTKPRLPRSIPTRARVRPEKPTVERIQQITPKETIDSATRQVNEIVTGVKQRRITERQQRQIQRQMPAPALELAGEFGMTDQRAAVILEEILGTRRRLIRQQVQARAQERTPRTTTRQPTIPGIGIPTIGLPFQAPLIPQFQIPKEEIRKRKRKRTKPTRREFAFLPSLLGLELGIEEKRVPRISTGIEPRGIVRR